MTLRRLLTWITGLSALGLLASQFADNPGQVVLNWQDYEIQTTVVVLAVLIGTSFAILIAILRMFGWILSGRKRWSESSNAKKQEQGLQSLTEAFAAMALSDYSFARKQTQRAQKLLSNSPLSLMFAAQLARMEGDEIKTREYLELMLQNDQTRFVAARGLVETYRRRGEWQQATNQALIAYELRPQDKWVTTTLIDLHSQQHHWQEALQIAEKSYKKRVITKPEFERIFALIHYENGKKLIQAKEWYNAQTFLLLAIKKQPAFVPAAVLLAQTFQAEGKSEAGFKVLVNAWRFSPHPDLANFTLLLFANELPLKRLKRIEKLVSSQPEHIESLVALANAALQAGELTQAKTLLDMAYRKENSVRICRLMAELCQRNPSSEHEASDWLLKASNANHDPQWTCLSCGDTSPQWESRCTACGSFDTMQWQKKQAPVYNASSN